MFNFNLQDNKENNFLYLNTLNSLKLTIPEDNSRMIIERFSPDKSKTKKTPGRKKKKTQYGIDPKDYVSFLNRKTTSNYDFNLKSPSNKRHSHIDFLNLKRQNENYQINKQFFTLNGYSNLKISYGKSLLSLLVQVKEGKLKIFDQIRIKKFYSFDENKKLVKLFQENKFYPFYQNYTENFKLNFVCSFSITGLNSSAEEMFNVFSNLKFENNYALLSNKLEVNQSLILIDNKKFYHSYLLPESEYSIISFRDELLEDDLSIERSNDIAILVTPSSLDKDPNNCDEKMVKDVSKLKSLFLDLNCHLDRNTERIINLNYENRKYSSEINKLKSDLEIKEQFLANTLTKLFHSVKEEEYKDSDLKEGDKNKITFRNNDNDSPNHSPKPSSKPSPNPSSDPSSDSGQEYDSYSCKHKLKYLQDKHNCEVDLIDGCIFERVISNDIIIKSSDTNCNIKDLPDTKTYYLGEKFTEEQFLCLNCYENVRDAAFINCGHAAYCCDCCDKFAEANILKETKTNKKTNHSKRSLMNKCRIDCPFCKTMNHKYMKLYFN